MKRSHVALIGALTLALAGSATPAFAATTPAQVTTGFSGFRVRFVHFQH